MLIISTFCWKFQQKVVMISILLRLRMLAHAYVLVRISLYLYLIHSVLSLFYCHQTGISPLHLAAKEGHLELCEHLVENGALPGVTTNVNNNLCKFTFSRFLTPSCLWGKHSQMMEKLMLNISQKIRIMKYL